LVSFAGSANNNIKRCGLMVEALCADFKSNYLCQLAGRPCFAFPALAEVAALAEQRWWELGWGYRAPRMVELCRQVLAQGGDRWLAGLSELSAPTLRTGLLALKGVGPKVADCVMLFSLQRHEVVPVDKGTAAHYAPRKQWGPEAAAAASEKLRAAFGPLAGWPFMTLFCAQLSPAGRW
jgi:N-glycosylase/DNA lyase